MQISSKTARVDNKVHDNLQTDLKLQSVCMCNMRFLKTRRLSNDARVPCFSALLLPSIMNMPWFWLGNRDPLVIHCSWLPHFCCLDIFSNALTTLHCETQPFWNQMMCFNLCCDWCSVRLSHFVLFFTICDQKTSCANINDGFDDQLISGCISCFWQNQSDCQKAVLWAQHVLSIHSFHLCKPEACAATHVVPFLLQSQKCKRLGDKHITKTQMRACWTIIATEDAFHFSSVASQLEHLIIQVACLQSKTINWEKRLFAQSLPQFDPMDILSDKTSIDWQIESKRETNCDKNAWNGWCHGPTK